MLLKREKEGTKRKGKLLKKGEEGNYKNTGGGTTGGIAKTLKGKREIEKGQGRNYEYYVWERKNFIFSRDKGKTAKF